MTDRYGEVVQHYGYHTYGAERFRDNTSAFSVSSRYTGQTLDEDTGLYYYGARYYDPELARFIQADSTIPDPEFSQAYNRYAYVYNNPLKFTDPTGQFAHLVAIVAMHTALTAATEAFVIKVVVTAIVASAISAGIAAATGGSVAQAGMAGLVGGFAGALGGVVGAMAAGALCAEMAGGNPLTGAMAAGVTVGISAAFAEIPIPSAFNTLEEVFLWQLSVATSAGALAGGVSAEMLGGDFGQGAASGAAGAAAGFVVAYAIQVHQLISTLNAIAESGEIPAGLMSISLASYVVPVTDTDEGLVAYTSIEDSSFEAGDAFWKAIKGLKGVPGHVVKNALRGFKSVRMSFGNHKFLLDKKAMKHILTRHHPKFWNGSWRLKQTFMSGKLTIEEVSSAARSVMLQNYGKLTAFGSSGSINIRGVYRGVEYVVGITNGRVGTMYPVK